MEAKIHTEFAAIFRRFSSLLFCCFIIPVVVIDEYAYQGQTGLCLNRTSSGTSADFVSVGYLGLANETPEEANYDAVITDIGNDSLMQQFFFNLCEWVPVTLSLLSYLVMVAMLVLFLYQNGQVSSLHRELKQLVKDSESKNCVLSQLQISLQCQQSNFTANNHKFCKLNKRLGKVESDLADENEELKKMYDYLNEWKAEWLEESDKLRRINPTYLKPSADSPNPKSIQRYVDQQNQEIQKYIEHAEKQFEKIQRSLQEDSGAIRDALDHLDFLQDVLNERDYGELY